MTNNQSSAIASGRSGLHGRWLGLTLFAGLLAMSTQACEDKNGRRAGEIPGSSSGGSGTGEGGAGGSSNGLGGENGDGDGDGDGDMLEMCAPAGETGPCADMACPFANQECIALDELTATCRCRPGFGGDECTDIDECQLGSPCGDTAECVNFDGGFRCDCLPGYEGDDCSNIDECAAGTDACADDCSDTDGAYDCSCGGGTFGDDEGSLCQGSDECAGQCGTGECTPTLGGHVCSCPLGATGPDCADTASCSLTTVLNEDVDPIIEDAVLRSYLHSITGIAPGDDITVGDLAALPSQSLILSPPFADGDPVVSSLEGLQCWTTLENVEIRGQEVDDLSPLANIGSLRSLSVGCSALTTLDGIEKLVGLESLAADSWSATLDDGMNGTLTVGCDRVERLTDISALSNLYNLTALDLGGHGLSDLDEIQGLRRLEHLNLRNNSLSNLSDLAGLVSLQNLDISDNNMTALSGLAGLPSLSVIDAADNAITDVSGIEDAVGPLLVLDLQANDLEDIEALASLTRLRELVLADNSSLQDAESLAQLVQLTELNISNTAVSSLAPFAESQDYGQDGGRLLAAGTEFVCEDEQQFIDELVSRGVLVFADVN